MQTLALPPLRHVAIEPIEAHQALTRRHSVCRAYLRGHTIHDSGLEGRHFVFDIHSKVLLNEAHSAVGRTLPFLAFAVGAVGTDNREHVPLCGFHRMRARVV